MNLLIDKEGTLYKYNGYHNGKYSLEMVNKLSIKPVIIFNDKDFKEQLTETDISLVDYLRMV